MCSTTVLCYYYPALEGETYLNTYMEDAVRIIQTNLGYHSYLGLEKLGFREITLIKVMQLLTGGTKMHSQMCLTPRFLVTMSLADVFLP